MKTLFALLTAAALTSVAWAQAIPLNELVGPNNSIRDPMYGMSVTFPAGWDVLGAQRWGKNNKENTIMFRPIWPLETRPSLYYQPTTNFAKPQPHEVESHFKYTAGTKAQQRVNGGLKDYRNLEDTFTFTTINGRPAFRYMALFTLNGKEHFEYFTRVMGDELMAMFFVMGPIEEAPVMRQEIDKMAATIQMP